MRRAVLEIGSRLTHMGLLSTPEDAFYASKGSLRRICTDSPHSADARATFVAEVRAALEAYRVARAHAPAWVLGVHDREDSADAEALVGIPGSPGVAEGIVHIVRGVEDFASFPTGAVLVARTTNPAWTSLFYSASAVVTEAGGPLSHGAVTAREMGIPAVMAVRNVLGTLSNGDRVRVDGTSGRVVLAPAVLS
jgi:pyruvate,water dikinase